MTDQKYNSQDPESTYNPVQNLSTKDNSFNSQNNENFQVGQYQLDTSVSGENSSQSFVSVQFVNSRKKSKKCGKILMYLGFIKMFLDMLGLIFLIISMLGFKIYNKNIIEEIFTPGQLQFQRFLKILSHISGFTQGWIMVRATKAAIRQISTQEINKDISFKRYTSKVQKYFKFLIMLIIFGIFMKAAINTYNFILMDTFFEREYKQDYIDYKMAHMYTANQFVLQFEKEKTENMQKVQEWFSTYGPFIIIVDILVTTSLCSMVVCCFFTYKKNLQFYEESPNNPAAQADNQIE